ncbi:nitrogen regulation protein NIFR3 [Staphylococcus aureus MUF168]|nr:nitrogen regulation protein NIFR3 [Staphylococcus aureus MUF168]
MPDLIEMIVFKVFTSWRGPTQKLTESQLTIMCKLAGPQHREFQKEILQTMQVGDQRNKFCEKVISVPLPKITT